MFGPHEAEAATLQASGRHEQLERESKREGERERGGGAVRLRSFWSVAFPVWLPNEFLDEFQINLRNLPSVQRGQRLRQRLRQRQRQRQITVH